MFAPQSHDVMNEEESHLLLKLQFLLLVIFFLITF